MPIRPPQTRIPPIETAPLPLREQINAELALYNQIGNMLALWAVVGICAREKLPLPDGVIDRLGEIGDEFVRYAVDEVPRARGKVADLVLGTSKEKGGDVFESYKIAKRNRSIVTRVFDLVMEDQGGLERNEKIRPNKKKAVKKRGSNKSRTSASRRDKPDPRPVIRTRTVVYEEVAAEFGVEPETVKRLFEQDERMAGSFAYRVISDNRNKGGIIDI